MSSISFFIFSGKYQKIIAKKKNAMNKKTIKETINRTALGISEFRR